MSAVATLPAEAESSDNGFATETARRAARNAAALAFANVVTKGALFAWQIALARLLGAEEYGIYGTIGALLAIGAAIPEFGMGLLVLRDVARRPQEAPRYLGATLTLQPTLAAVGYALLLAAAWLLGYSGEIRALLALAALSLLVDALGNMCHNQLLAQERMVLPALISVGHVAALLVLGGAALLAGWGLWGLYAATIAAGLWRAAMYWLALGHTGVRPSLPADRALMGALLRDGWPIALNAFLFLAYQHTDKLVTTAVLGAEGTGQLMAGFVIVFGVIELLSTTVLVAVFPMMSRMWGEGQERLFQVLLEKLAFFNLLASVPIALFTSLLAVPLSALLFGAGFTKTASVLEVLIWYTAVAMVNNVFAQALLIQNRQRRLLAFRTLGLALNVALLLALLPLLDVQGAAVGTLLAECVILVALVRSFTFPADWWARVRNHIWRLAGVALVTAATVWALRDVHPLLAAAVGAPLYVALVLGSGALAPDDWDLLYRMTSALPGGAWVRRWWRREVRA